MWPTDGEVKMWKTLYASAMADIKKKSRQESAARTRDDRPCFCSRSQVVDVCIQTAAALESIAHFQIPVTAILFVNTILRSDGRVFFFPLLMIHFS